MNKTCFKCGKEKDLSEFYKHSQMKDGHLGKCKECTKNDVTIHYHKNISKMAIYERERTKRIERKINKAIYQARRREIYPDVFIANGAVNNAIRYGRMVRPAGCSICGYEKIEAHHSDYSKPLDVVWLCRKHHLAEHGKQPFPEV